MASDGWWRRLETAGAYRITEIPRPDEGIAQEEGPRSTADHGMSQRVAALAAAYHAGGLVAFGWVRTAIGGPVHVVAAGDALAGSAACGPDSAAGVDGTHGAGAGVLLALPGGARGTVLRPGELAGLLGRIGCWRDIAGISDGLLAPDSAAAHSAAGARYAGPSLEEGLLASWTEPFGWIVTAQPLSASELRSLADEVARRQRLAETAADRFPERAVDARRLAQRHAEVRRGISAGFWRVRVLAGGCGQARAARVAGLLCASFGLDGLPYALTPAPPSLGTAHSLDPALACHPGGDAAPASPFYGSTELLAALARPPRSEIPGLRLALRSGFDVTQEVPGAPGAAIHLGDVLDRNRMPAGPFTLPLDSLNRHVFVCGATGAGKSQTVRSLLEAATVQHIPWLVVEPAKAEYRLMANRVPGTTVIRIRPGEADATAAGLNPLEPAGDGGARFPLQTHADLVKALFIASFRSEEPFPQVLSAALTRVYEQAGWDLALGEPANTTAGYPTLTDLQRAAEQVVGEIGYSQRVTDDVLGFIRVRLASLRQGTTGRFLEGGHQIDFGALMRNNVVLEIEDVGDDRDKAFLMGTVLIRLAEHLRLTHRAGAPSGQDGGGATLRHLTVVEEAHRLLRRQETAAGAGVGGPGAAGYAVEMFAGLLAEIRAYGEGLVIAEQIPARLLPDVIKNTAVKITHRLPAADDRDAVGATMNATPEQSRYLVTLPTGQAAAFADGMDFPVLVKIKDGTERDVAAVPRTADARTVVSRRSATCGTECVGRPCTLREIRGAQRALGASNWVAVWAELTVLAHLSGWPMPVPAPARLTEFRRLPVRLSQCATSLAVDAAAATRAAAIDSPGSPAALAGHACAAIRARVERDQWLCEPDEPEWRMDGQVTETVAFGAARPSIIEAAGPLTAVLGAFIDCRWPVPYLRRSAAEMTTSPPAGASTGLQGSRTPPGPP